MKHSHRDQDIRGWNELFNKQSFAAKDQKDKEGSKLKKEGME